MAESLTDKLKLSKRDTGDINWGQGANANLDAVDQHAQQATLRPPRTLSASLGSGAVGANLLGSTTYFYKVTAVNAAGETTEGKIPAAVEAQVTESAGPVPVILSWETVKGATGYKIYKSTLSGQEKFLASIAGESTAIYTDDGNTAVNGAISVPAANTARTAVSKIVAGTNVTISPPDGTGDVTINAAGSAPADASDAVKGITRLSVAPAVASNPIAVGDNDTRNSDARTPTGAAAGDLSGTYPNPAVAKVNGTSVPAAPSAGQVLTATGPTAATWQTPAGGGGYGTLVVAAPSGVAATDTANIQNAINTVNAGGGGTVVLKEGIYQISTTINPKSGVTIRGQGKSTVQNTGLSGTSGGGSPSGTTLRGTTGLGATRMISDTGTAPINVTFRDLNLDFGKVTRGSIAGQDMVMKGSNLTFINVTFIMTASVGNPSVDITPSNTFDAGKHKFIGCDFYDSGTAATICYQLDGLISGCYFEGTVATFNEMVAFVGAANVTNCYFASNKNYNNGMVYVQPANNGNQAQTVTISNCFFKQYTTGQTRAIFVNNITSGNVVISGNVGDSSSAAVGNIHCPASSGLRNIIGNVGFSAYSGGNQNGNDGQTAINSNAAAGGDLSGTLPNPTVAKVNGVSVPASPSAGQVLTATGPAAANWQTPTAAATPGFGTLLGTGADGAATIAVSTALPATSTMGTTYGVGANVDNVNHSVAVKNYTDLTIDAGQTLSLEPGVAGMIIRCTGTVTINGVIDVTGAAQNGGGTSSPGGPGASVVGGAIPPTSLCPKLGPAAGGTGSAASGATGGSYAIIGAGGGGGGYGFGGTDTGGVGGTAPGVGIINYLRYLLARAYENIFLTGSGGGISGAGGGPSAGSGGGFIYIFANQIVIGPAGAIKANGANAPTGATTATGGCGGGGGGGGFILLAYKTSLTNNGAVQANGGNGGSSLTSGQVPTAGPAGGTNTTINGTPTSGATGQTSSFVGAGGSGSGGVIIGTQI